MTYHLSTGLIICCMITGACSSRITEESAIRRGDVAFAAGDFEEALAEYRLAVRQGAADASVTSRVAHTYAMMGQVDDAGAYYLETSSKDDTYVDQAVSDLMRLAVDARDNNDRFAMATAVETAFQLRPGIGVGNMSLPLAQHYFENGEYGRAIPFYQSAMADATDSLPEIVFEIAQAYEEIGDCEHALLGFERFREMVRPWERGEVDWYIGTCAFTLSHDVMNSGPLIGEEELDRALELIERVVEVGEPRNIQAQAWFDMGEIFSQMGACEEAMSAYEQVRYMDQSGALIDRALRSYDEIRFGRGLGDSPEDRCR